MRYHGNYFQFVSISDTNVRPASEECSREKNYVGEHHAYPVYIPPSLTHICSCILAKMFKCLHNSDIK